MAGLLEHVPHLAPSRSYRLRRSAWSFYLVLTVVLVLAVVSFLVHSSDSINESPLLSSIQKRDFVTRETLSSLLAGTKHEKCRHVHKAKDQCAFVLANCADHKVGLLSYLQLYYCKLPHAKPVAFIIIALWLSLLFSTVGIAASDFLCVNLSTIASILGMSESLTGVTFLAFGNGSPDVFSTFAAMSSNSGSLAIGELIGAAGFISAVVAGSMALVRPFKVARRSFVRDVAFFICATTTSLVFIADGKLHVWECALMIGFYVFYVITVVTWHWYLTRQRKKQERDLMARSHFHIPQNQELDIQVVPEDEDGPVAGAQRPLLGPSEEDFESLERADVPVWKVEDEDDEARDRYLAELQGNMRVSRPPVGQRGTTTGPIRPSLVGALEFRSVLSSLERSRSIHSGRIHLRSYSDDPDQPQVYADALGHEATSLRAGVNRGRALSANPPLRPELHGALQNETRSERGVPLLPKLGVSTAPTPTPTDQSQFLYASPTSSGFPSRSQSPSHRGSKESPRLLAPPGEPFRQPTYSSGGSVSNSRGGSVAVSPLSRGAQHSHLTFSEGVKSPPIQSPVIPFPTYCGDVTPTRSGIPSLQLPPPASSAGSRRASDTLYIYSHQDERPLSWWPYHYLPPPNVLVSTLLPTLSSWEDKSIWDKFLGFAAAPSVFFLTITLPVVEPPDAGSESDSSPAIASPLLDPVNNAASDSQAINSIDPNTNLQSRLHSRDESNERDPRNQLSAPLLSPPRHRSDSEAPVVPTALEQTSLAPKRWNRWLLAIQFVTAPFFITLTAWANFDSDLDGRNLLIPALVSLLVSAILLCILIFTTRPTTKQVPRRARPFLAFLGFIVSIAWISTLATEVVNLLKSIGVILRISDSLLGLTVFAVGNSLGDLVANVTVAKLGYPIMALSACFGGPMLNILIGIGVGGLYMTLNPTGKQFSSSSISSSLGSVVARTVSAKQEPYPISISKSLLISGATLLATLLGLLVVVPLNDWKMDRKIGLGLVAMWCVCTLCNVIVEVLT